jgi:hypothetical protein
MGSEGWPHYQALVNKASRGIDGINDVLALGSNLTSAINVFRARVLVSVLNTDLTGQYGESLDGVSKAKESGGMAAGAGSGAENPGRNDPCGCGSGKKYKRCCGK